MSHSMKMHGDRSGGKKGALLEGLKTRSASSALPGPKGGSVNAGATRSEPSKAAPTIGPRTA
jgi:hypothetical protein